MPKAHTWLRSRLLEVLNAKERTREADTRGERERVSLARLFFLVPQWKNCEEYFQAPATQAELILTVRGRR